MGAQHNLVNATMCFLRKNKKTLFLDRHAGKGKDRHHGYYVPPGGRFRENERGVDCIVREFEEETGYLLINPRLKAISTFYNQGRELGGEANPDDWQVEVFEASDFRGMLKEEHPKAKPIWVPDSRIREIKLYPGDRLILSLLDLPGVYQTIAQYIGKELVKFDIKRAD